MKFKYYFVTAASCMVILGSGVSHAEATASWHTTGEQHRKINEDVQSVSANAWINRLSQVLTGDLALSNEQKKQIQTLADHANEQIEVQKTKLSETQNSLHVLRGQKITTSEQFSAWHRLMNQQALARSDIMFAQQQYTMSVINLVLREEQSSVLKRNNMERRYRKSPNELFTAQRQQMPVTQD